MEVEPCWPDDMNGIPIAQQNTERATQRRQQNQRYMDYSPRGLKPNYLQIEAQEQLTVCPSATWKDFSTHNIQEDVILQVCSNFLHDVEQIRIELAKKHQEMRNIRTELQEHRVNWKAGNFRPWAPSQKGNQKLSGSVTIVKKTDKHQNGVAKRCETKKLGECNTKCPSTRILLPYRNTELVTPFVHPCTIKTWPDALIWTFWRFPLINF